MSSTWLYPCRSSPGGSQEALGLLSSLLHVFAAACQLRLDTWPFTQLHLNLDTSNGRLTHLIGPSRRPFNLTIALLYSPYSRIVSYLLSGNCIWMLLVFDCVMSHVEREPWKTLRGLCGKGVGGLSKTKTKEKQVGKTHAYRCRPRRALEEESRLRQLVERGGAGRGGAEA